MKVLIVGAAGQVGRALRASAPAHIELHTTTREQLDIADPIAVRRVVASHPIDVLINAAAYTAVDRAEVEGEQAAAINALAPGYLAEAVRAQRGCRLIHISTDYVFDGRGQRPYRPDDPPHPMSVYGRTKLQGERTVAHTLGERALILRTAWVYAAQGRNFLLTMLRLMRERGEVRVVADQRGTPTSSLSVARAIWSAVDSPGAHGVLHWTDAGEASWYEFACAIAEEASARGLLPSAPRVHPIRTVDYPTAAVRPANSVLDLAACAAMLGLAPTPWREGLQSVLDSLVEG